MKKLFHLFFFRSELQVSLAISKGYYVLEKLRHLYTQTDNLEYN